MEESASTYPDLSRMIQDARDIFDAAVRGTQADHLLAEFYLEEHLKQPVAAYRRVIVMGAGKASMAMAGALEERLERIDAGLVVVPHGYRDCLPSSQRFPIQIEVVEAGHPVPDVAGVEAARRVGAFADEAEEDDLLIVLLSGGGSALWPAFAEGISLDDAQTAFRLLLRSGADIHQINTVRKHLSVLSGGHLAARAAPATVLALVVSDVVGDDLSVIASGPTVPDSSTFEDAREVLASFDLWEEAPKSIRGRIERGMRGVVDETPKPGEALFDAVKTILLGTNRSALTAARAAAVGLGYDAEIVRSDLTGEARDLGATLVQQALASNATSPSCLLWGGETTVAVTGGGKGGRNQELALAAALDLDGLDRRVVVLSGGTDGIDGPTDAAGAWATPATVSQAKKLGLEPRACLADNDAYTFFDELDALLRTGPTHTNVMDVQVVLVNG